MEYRPLVSVIIPIYNRSGIVGEAIDSVLSQKYDNYEIILVDDGSTDNTREVLRRYLDADTRIVYLHQKNSGPSAARNTGIRKAKGELIAFLDSDDVWHSEKLGKQVPYFCDNPRLGLVASGLEVRDAQWRFTHVTLPDDGEMRQLKQKKLHKNLFTTSSVIVRADCFGSVGLFDDTIKYAEDWDMWLRILSRYECDIVREPLVFYRSHLSNITHQNLDTKFIDWYKVINKNDDKNTGCVTRRKRLSWFFLNQAYQYRQAGNKGHKRYLMKSIIAWPFWFAGRYWSLCK